jgi:uncharacterized protein (UPF0548 family)
VSAPFSFGFPPGSVLSDAALTDAVPRGYRPLRATAVVGGEEDFERLVGEVLAWRVQRASGVRVLDERGEDAADVVLGREARVVIPLLGVGALRLELAAPVRVTAVVREPDRAGFAYGTLPGHPEHGEEAWLLERRDGRVTLTIRALSRTALPYALAPAVSRAFQRRYTDRYLAALLP